MKKIILILTVMVITINALAQKDKNPFGLVYDNAIVKNEKGKVNIHPITYKTKNITVSANVYTPADYDKNKKYPAIVVAHPNGGVKEQVAGAYAQILAQHGFITIYYGVDYAHPNATGTYTASSMMELMNWDATDRMNLIAQPLLIIAGSKADSKYMSDEAFEKATGTLDKEYFIRDGATHIQTYFVKDYVKQVENKLNEFFSSKLRQ
ncbi:MAG: alpha/beta hydrolase [Bacteroidales bacterium]|nr:alpha/beta hydrolase [Bacteroidales bacterium]